MIISEQEKASRKRAFSMIYTIVENFEDVHGEKHDYDRYGFSLYDYESLAMYFKPAETKNKSDKLNWLNSFRDLKSSDKLKKSFTVIGDKIFACDNYRLAYIDNYEKLTGGYYNLDKLRKKLVKVGGFEEYLPDRLQQVYEANILNATYSNFDEFKIEDKVNKDGYFYTVISKGDTTTSINTRYFNIIKNLDNLKLYIDPDKKLVSSSTDGRGAAMMPVNLK